MEIKPYEGLGELRFGATRKSIRTKLRGTHRSFQKVPGANETDAYDQLGLHLYFDEDERLEFIEVFKPASPTFRRMSFLGRDMFDVEDDLAALGYLSLRDDVGLQSNSAGIGVYAPNGIVEGLAVFRRGYYGKQSGVCK